jgi:hypothetical protein
VSMLGEVDPESPKSILRTRRNTVVSSGSFPMPGRTPSAWRSYARSVTSVVSSQHSGLYELRDHSKAVRPRKYLAGHSGRAPRAQPQSGELACA